MMLASCIAAAITVCDVRVSAGEPRHAEKRFFVDFRARPGELLGHTFVVYGRVDRFGRMHRVRYAGLFPKKTEKAFVLMSARARIRGGVKADLQQPATVIYRKHLTAAQFMRVRTAIRRVRATEPYWNLLFFNCNDFAIEVAEALGLRHPPGLLPPINFVAALRDLNEG